MTRNFPAELAALEVELDRARPQQHVIDIRAAAIGRTRVIGIEMTIERLRQERIDHLLANARRALAERQGGTVFSPAVGER